MPPLVKHQPPVALDDRATVRAGDIVTVPVLANDYHPPDASKLLLSPELDLADAPGALAFTDGDELRFQAPEKAGVQTIAYEITDEYEQTARAVVTFTVVARGENRAPTPVPLTSRTFDGSSVRIDVPLDGLDPDGDSVVLTDYAATPVLGRISERTSTSFTYTAFPGSTGTDIFDYEVEDAFGEKARATIRIGVIPRPATQAPPPKAVDDVVEMKPGRRVGIEVLLNDSDPNGSRCA